MFQICLGVCKRKIQYLQIWLQGIQKSKENVLYNSLVKILSFQAGTCGAAARLLRAKSCSPAQFSLCHCHSSEPLVLWQSMELQKGNKFCVTPGRWYLSMFLPLSCGLQWNCLRLPRHWWKRTISRALVFAASSKCEQIGWLCVNCHAGTVLAPYQGWIQNP